MKEGRDRRESHVKERFVRFGTGNGIACVFFLAIVLILSTKKRITIILLSHLSLSFILLKSNNYNKLLILSVKL